MRYIFFIFIFIAPDCISAQIIVENDTLYGNEWIDFEQDYYKIAIAEEGIYRLDYQILNDLGIFSSSSSPLGSNFQLFLRGEQVPIAVSTDVGFNDGDFIEFYGQTNKAELDVHLFPAPNQMLNPKYSLFNDTAYYFLTWSDTPAERVTVIENDLNDPPTKAPYCQYTSEVIRNQKYFKKKFSGSNDEISQFELGDGYGSNISWNISQSVATPYVYTEESLPVNLNLRVGSDGYLHYTKVLFNNATVLTDSFNSWSLHDYDIPLFNTDLNATNDIKHRGDTTIDKHSVAYFSITYPRTFDFDNEKHTSFGLPPNTISTYLEIEGLDLSATPIIYDLTNNLRLESVVEDEIVKVVLPPSSNDRIIGVGAPQTINSSEIVATNFINYFDQDADYILLTHYKILDDGNGNNYVQEYANYRASVAGGNFSPIIIDVQQLYDQFGYGINRHVLSFRNFGFYIKKYWPNSPYIFIIGKGRFADEVRKLNTLEIPNANYLIPSFGKRASDNLLFSKRESAIPFFPIGRLAALNPIEVQNYLNKVQAHEAAHLLPQTVENKAWMKRIIHLSGGDPAILADIRNRMNNYKNIIENSQFGANVVTFNKSSTDIIQESSSQNFSDLMDQGAAMISFFGHASPYSFDFNIGSPEDYNNVGKFPLLYSIACYAGNIFTSQRSSISEQFVLSNKGAIAFMSSTDFSNVSTLNNFATRFYNHLGEDSYGERLGTIIRNVVSEIEGNSNSLSTQKLNESMTLHGDPALKIYVNDAPDYIIDPASIHVSPRIPNTRTENIVFEFDVNNIGSAKEDSILFEITHIFPSGEETAIHEEKISAPFHANTQTVNIPNTIFKNAVGKNTLRIEVDTENAVDEFPNPDAENNNDIETMFHIISNDIFPAFPYNYSIINNNSIILKASTSNIFPEEQLYFIEIDTSKYFNSPLKQTKIQQQQGGIINWQPEIPAINNTVYYWRTSLDSTQTNTGDFNWNYSSFLLLNDSSPGWNQSHFFQFNEDKLNFITLKESDNRTFNFLQGELNVKTFNGITSSFFGNDKKIASLLLEENEIDNARGCGFTAGVRIYIIDPLTFEPWEHNDAMPDFNSFACSADINDVQSFNYKTNTIEEREYVIELLENIVPDGHIVLFHTFQYSLNFNFNYKPDEWAADALSNAFGKSLFDVLESQGATLIRNTEITGSVPYTFFYQKGNPDFEFKQEALADTITDIITFDFAMPGSWSEGSIETEAIGPAQNWGTFEWLVDEIDTQTDTMFVNIYGIDQEGSATLLINNVIANDTSLTNIDASIYPYLRLELNAIDNSNRTIAQLGYWRVYYSPLPEATLNPEAHLMCIDTIQQGAPLQMAISIDNISDTDMDSLLFKYTVIDEQNNETVYNNRLAPLPKDDALIATLDINTKNLQGTQQIIMEINPDNDQAEQFHYNNVGIKSFFVDLDNRNPLLDVTFDGIHILNQDIVSPKPFIHISLQDENQYLALEDTALFRISVLYPDESIRRFYFEEDIMVFYPANSANLEHKNEAHIELQPHFQQDGIHQLIIRSKDETGNFTGVTDYSIEFEVITTQSISNLLNYPNPFSTSTQFVFTLTGEDLPENMQIQIMTVSGKIIREIDLFELGNIHTGRNISEFKWDGTDEYGDKLANGVYLYRVVTQKTGGDVYDHFNTDADKFFKSGFGKMVILR